MGLFLAMGVWAPSASKACHGLYRASLQAPTVPRKMSTQEVAVTPAQDDLRDSQRQIFRSMDRRTFLSSTAAAFHFVLTSGNMAFADVKIALSNIQADPVTCPEGQTTVTGGTSFGAACFRITGDATNPTKQTVYNADIFGRVYDAQGEPALDTVENLRLDTIAEIPPGKSKISFQITVNAGQAKLGPLELKNFKATGYLGKVNNRQGSGRLDDIDFSELDPDF